jgi:hypothetical protein
MSFKTYFKIALFFPYIIGVLAFLIIYLIEPSEMISLNLLFMTVLPIFFASIPYAIFIILAFSWVKSRSDRAIKRAMWLAPLYFIPLMMLIPILMMSSDSIFELTKMIAAIMGLTLAYGYFYVLLAHGGWLIVKKVGWGKEID